MTESTLEHSLLLENLNETLEPLIRRIIREELTRLIQNNPLVFSLNANSSLYQDMEDILQRKKENKLQFFSDSEVWG
ncbi:MAG: hypothetical protein GQ569_02480 [Methylococcaceae bacterium]|nr:hypothetical protein [Methylococcaceae bacterium]